MKTILEVSNTKVNLDVREGALSENKQYVLNTILFQKCLFILFISITFWFAPFNWETGAHRSQLAGQSDPTYIKLSFPNLSKSWRLNKIEGILKWTILLIDCKVVEDTLYTELCYSQIHTESSSVGSHWECLGTGLSGSHLDLVRSQRWGHNLVVLIAFPFLSLHPSLHMQRKGHVRSPVSQNEDSCLDLDHTQSLTLNIQSLL